MFEGENPSVLFTLMDNYGFLSQGNNTLFFIR